VTMEASSLDNLSDVILSGSTVDQVLKYNGTNWVNASFTLDALSNVDVPTPTADDALIYNGTNWVNQAQTWLKSGSDIYYTLGNVGIGAVPTQKFDVTGTLQATQILIPDSGVTAGDVFLRIGDESFLTDVDLVDTIGIYGGADTTIGNIKLGSNGPVISGANGNLGIGTTTAPISKLDVNGTGKFSSDLTISSLNTSGVVTNDNTGKLSTVATVPSTNGGVPSGAVMFFDLAACPAGWSEMTSARGRYIAGKTSSGTLAATVGTALTDKENRAVGKHNHSITDPGHGHSLSNVVSAGHTAYNDSTTCVNVVPRFGLISIVTALANTTGITLGSSGDVDGTNAPYIQLLTCKKD